MKTDLSSSEYRLNMQEDCCQGARVLAESRAGIEMATRFSIVRQVHGAEASQQSCWKVSAQVITRPVEAQSPVITGQVHGDGVRQKPGQKSGPTGHRQGLKQPG